MTTYTDKDGDTLEVRSGSFDKSELLLRAEQFRDGTGTVSSAVLLPRDKAVQLRNQLLELYPVEVSPFPLVFEDRDGDTLTVKLNTPSKPVQSELFFMATEDGAVLKKEQALQLANAIIAHYEGV